MHARNSFTPAQTIALRYRAGMKTLPPIITNCRGPTPPLEGEQDSSSDYSSAEESGSTGSDDTTENHSVIVKGIEIKYRESRNLELQAVVRCLILSIYLFR
jgi:hypothetical protein